MRLQRARAPLPLTLGVGCRGLRCRRANAAVARFPDSLQSPGDLVPSGFSWQRTCPGLSDRTGHDLYASGRPVGCSGDRARLSGHPAQKEVSTLGVCYSPPQPSVRQLGAFPRLPRPAHWLAVAGVAFALPAWRTSWRRVQSPELDGSGDDRRCTTPGRPDPSPPT